MFLSRVMKRNKMTRAQADAILERAKTEEPLELEKGDFTAMLIAAFIVFMPILLGIAAVLGFVYFFIFHIWAA